MQNNKTYLKQNVLAEPLFNQWYGWPFIISPSTAAMYVANSHMKIMQSFLSSPQAHISALKNPLMAGGPFINYDASRVGDIINLMARTVKEQSHLLKFAEAVKTINDLRSYAVEPKISDLG